MLIQNQYDGRLYEVPDVAGYGEYAGPGYHGLGIPFLAPFAAKIGARLLPKALPFARRFLRRFRRRIPGIIRRPPFLPGLPFPGGPPPIPSAVLSTRVARKVVAMLRQQGLQVTPAAPPGPPPQEPEAGAPPPGPEPQPGMAEYPYDPQGADQDSDPYAEQYPEGYPYQYPYQPAHQYPYTPASPWQRFSRRFPGRRFPGAWRGRSQNWPRRGAGVRGAWMGARARRPPSATIRRAAPARVRPTYRRH